MNLRKHAKLYRMFCWVAMFNIVMPFLSSLPAVAQVAAPMQVGVVEFRNDSGVQGKLLARYATDAVVIEMSKSARLDVISRQQTEQQMKELGLTPPLSQVELRKLGEALAAEAMVEGAVKAVQLSGSGASRRAAVTIVIRMVDQASGEVINGAIQTGFATASPGEPVDDDKLITRALNNAAYQAVKTMTEYVIPEATVLATVRTNELLLNRGARDGIKSGMKMIVTRLGEIIGEIKITAVEPDQSTAYITKALRGIRPEDKCRAVFDMPAVEEIPTTVTTKTGGPAAKAGPKIGGITKLVAPLLALAFFAAMYKPHGESIGIVTAEAGLSGYDLPLASGTPGVRIKWNRDKLGKGTNVIEYHIWRDDLSGPVLVARPSEGEAFDDATAREIDYQTADPETHELTSETSTVPALVLGRPHRYYVSALYVVTSVGEPQYYETERVKTGQVTPVAQIPAANLRLPAVGTQVDLRDVTFEWLSRAGMDTYIVETSLDPTFSNPEYVSTQIRFSPSLDGQTVSLKNVNLSSVYPSVTADTIIWWRVGCRASTDSPGPIPPPGRPSMRYIYSEPSSFSPVELPPPHP